MQRSKYVNNSNRSQGVEVKDTANVKDTDKERIKDIIENSCKQRSIVRIDRRWEFEILSRMKVKLLNKAEKKVETTVRRVVWGISWFSELCPQVIKLYSNSAFRFVVFRSNRRYIPGD